MSHDEKGRWCHCDQPKTKALTRLIKRLKTRPLRQNMECQAVNIEETV